MSQTSLSTHPLATARAHGVEGKHTLFLAHAVPVEDADAALQALAEVSVPDATHNCWAWRIGEDYRSNDDGEPAGTAGRPIRAAIDGQGMDPDVDVVTRWFRTDERRVREESGRWWWSRGDLEHDKTNRSN